MTVPGRSHPKRVVLVEGDDLAGRVLERALDSRGLDVTRLEHTATLSPVALDGCDVVLLVLDDDDATVFELLLWLSAQPRHPYVVMLTRRADARMLGSAVLRSLGIDRLIAWPCRVDKLSAVLESAQPPHEPLRLVS